jgi:hypothetical protein
MSTIVPGWAGFAATMDFDMVDAIGQSLASAVRPTVIESRETRPIVPTVLDKELNRMVLEISKVLSGLRAEVQGLGLVLDQSTK